MKTVLLIGCDGYIGHALTLRLLERGYKVIGVDDFQRRYNVKKMSSFSATDIQDPKDRHKLFKSIGEFDFIECSIDTEIEKLENFMNYKMDCVPDVIVNLAQQPSGPFSLKSQKDAVETSYNNLIGTLNILYYMKKYSPGAHLIQIGSMGEYDHGMGVDIAEGVFDFRYKNRTAKNIIFPRRPGSFYHASKVASTYYIECACRWWGLSATDIMQGVIYSNFTPEIEKYNSHTRLDSDECFGTVVNRFIVQTIINEPMTIFGEGEQKRGYLALNDSIQCLMLAIENIPKEGEYRTWNQLDTIHTINEIAERITKVAKKYGLNPMAENIEPPRAEQTTEFNHYKIDTNKLKKLGFKPTRTMEQEAEFLFKTLLPLKNDLYPLKNVVKPIITWK